MVARQLQLLKEAVPKTSRVTVLYNSATSYGALLVKETEAAARSLGVQVHLVEVRGADALDRGLSTVAKNRADALFVLFDPVLFAHRARIAQFASQYRLPAMYPHTEYAQAACRRVRR